MGDVYVELGMVFIGGWGILHYPEFLKWSVPLQMGRYKKKMTLEWPYAVMGRDISVWVYLCALKCMSGDDDVRN